MLGQNEIGFIAVIQALITAPQDNWKELSQEFSWLLIHAQPNFPEKFFPGNDSINHLFRSLQYRIAVEVEPERAPKILEIWDKETKPYEPHQLYLLDRLEVATEALMYCQASLSAKQIVGYLREIIDITDNDNEVQKIYCSDFIAQFEEQKGVESNYFSFLFSIIYRAPRPTCASFLSDLIEALDELPVRIRTLLLADFKDDSVDSRLLIDGVWLAEENLENPDWQRCLQVFDKVIEKALAWGYPHLAAASARGKAIIHDECLHNPDAAHKVLEDIVAKVGTFPVNRGRTSVCIFSPKALQRSSQYLRAHSPRVESTVRTIKRWSLEEYRRAAICAAQLNDWEKSATFFEAWSKKNPKD